MPKLSKYDLALAKLYSCNALKDQLVVGLATSKSGKPHTEENPDRIDLQHMTELVTELDLVHKNLLSLVADNTKYFRPPHGVNWVGEDDLARLGARLDHYKDTLEVASKLGAEDARRLLIDNVYAPILRGSRYLVITDPTSKWIHTGSDFCEPARIYKNYLYASAVYSNSVGYDAMVNEINYVLYEYYFAAERFGVAVGRGAAEIVSDVRKSSGMVGLVGAAIIAGAVAVLIKGK